MNQTLIQGLFYDIGTVESKSSLEKLKQAIAQLTRTPCDSQVLYKIEGTQCSLVPESRMKDTKTNINIQSCKLQTVPKERYPIQVIMPNGTIFEDEQEPTDPIADLYEKVDFFKYNTEYKRKPYKITYKFHDITQILDKKMLFGDFMFSRYHLNELKVEFIKEKFKITVIFGQQKLVTDISVEARVRDMRIKAAELYKIDTNQIILVCQQKLNDDDVINEVFVDNDVLEIIQRVG